MSANAALKTWELENSVQLVDPTRDALYASDPALIESSTKGAPWRSNPHYFTSVKISSIALLKMTMHARSGGNIEIMGLMQGYPLGRSLIITDAFRLPVEGTETRVAAQSQADEYIVQYLEKCRESGQMENAVGWYHSHPGYGCWLSGIDVQTQMLQQLGGPFVAVVIDPDRTISAGKVEIGAFRTFPEGYTPEEKGAVKATGGEDDEGFESIPLNKIEDFGAHAARYYSLSVSHFKSTLDSRLLEALWEKYWIGTLAASPLFSNREYSARQMKDLSLKIGQIDRGRKARGSGGGGSISMGARTGKASKQDDRQLEKIVKAGNKIAMEEEQGLLAAKVKQRLFEGVGTATATGTTIGADGRDVAGAAAAAAGSGQVADEGVVTS